MKPYIIISSFLLPILSFGQKIDGAWIIYTPEPLDLESRQLKSNSSDLKCIFKDPYMYSLSTEKHLTPDDISKKLGLSKSAVVFQDEKLEKRLIPNDTRYNEQWNLRQISLEDVWSETVGQTPVNRDPVVIAVIDDGFEMNHSDLDGQWWTNEAEIPGDNIDNDNNSFIDDYQGFNTRLLNDDHTIDEHGTQVAGIIGAKGNNNVGIAGVAWETKMLAISDVDNFGKLIAGMDYVYTMKKLYLDTDGERGANIVVNNFSGGITNRFPSQFPGWCETYDKLGSVGVLSVTAVANTNINPEADGDMPTLCGSDFLITVTNTRRTDLLDNMAASSSISVDLGAPGESIITTGTRNSYINLPGTSASSPHVTGVIGLIYNLNCEVLQDLIDDNPEQAAREIKNAILDNVDKNNSLDETVSGGRLNALNAFLSFSELCGDVITVEKLSLRHTMQDNVEWAPSSFIYSTDTFEQHDFYIYDRIGRLIFHKAVYPTLFGKKTISINNEIEIETSGIYFATLANSKDKSTVKFSVIKN